MIAIASSPTQRPLFHQIPREPVIAIAAFKLESQLEVWGARTRAGPYTLLLRYPIAAMSGMVGPKRREGDLQVPEGFYYIDRFNPQSRFHKSLGLNYPNDSDRIRGLAGHLGKDIFIHGNRVSAGCLAITDPVIDVVYRLADYARSHGEREIPVSIYPCRMSGAVWERLKQTYAGRRTLIKFWESLVPGYKIYLAARKWPNPNINSRGEYVWDRLILD